MAHRWNLSITRVSLIGLLLLGSFIAAFAQNEYKLIKKVPLKGVYMTTDRFGFCYVVNGKNQALKIDNKGEISKYYDINVFGDISVLDATNPLRVLLFFEGYATVVILDRTMTEKVRMPLFERGFNPIEAISSSQDNNIWVYDAVEFRLKKLNDDLRVIVKSEDLSMQLGTILSPNFMLQRDNYLYVNDPEKGIFIFDLFGTYVKTIPIMGLVDFQKFGQKLVYFQEGKLYTYDLLTLKTQEIALPISDSPIIDAHIQQGMLYVLHKNGLALYAY